jgi:hypothetical protein
MGGRCFGVEGAWGARLYGGGGISGDFWGIGISEGFVER